MKITLLGTGTPLLDPTRQQSALLVEIEDTKLLVDAGRGVTSQLLKIGLQPQQIDEVFITHHHYDHISNLGEFLLTAWHNGRTLPLMIYGPPGTAEIVAALFQKIYARDIAFALFNNGEMADIKKIVQVTEVTAGLIRNTHHYRIFTEYVNHGNSLGLSPENWPCLGYRIEAHRKVIALSGDTVACVGLDRLAQAADCLIQCCYLAEAEITTPGLERLATHVIASARQAGQIAAHNQVKQLVLTHIRPKSEAMMQSLIEDVRGSYGGELLLGEDLMVINV